MNTTFLLMARYEGLAVVPLAQVCKDYFSHLTPEQLVRKAGAGEIALPILRMERDNRKAAKGVHLTDLAAWIDARAEEARKECRLMCDASNAGASVSRPE